MSNKAKNTRAFFALSHSSYVERPRRRCIICRREGLLNNSPDVKIIPLFALLMWEHYSSCVSRDVGGTPLLGWRDASVGEAKDICRAAIGALKKHSRRKHNSLHADEKERVLRVSRFVVCIIVASLGKRQDKLLVVLFYSVTTSFETRES